MLIAGYSHAGNLSLAKKFFDRIPQRNQFSWSSIIAAYAKLGHLESALEAFHSVPDPDVFCWTAIVAAFAQKGLGDAAMELFQALILEGIELDSVAFLTILSACSHAGMLIQARYFLDRMSSDHGIAPSKSHVSCVIAMLGRAGQLLEAEGLMIDTPSSENAVEDLLPGWMALLGSSRVHSEIELGARAAARVAGLNAGKGSSYVLLASVLHASA
ncbi:hypothetical protein SELMODRAFT_107264 [Selaginella moellendorffii]|uniref:Pentacotripeptide-repeat region of PRORP domain-containing protein n=1 Tax=Selaginella moellendorffii TaxID=88036 RepID=D8S264_SELML|nr:hypothetical protein SELMODRAFT_107264 [Selaginella moellendorffii]